MRQLYITGCPYQAEPTQRAEDKPALQPLRGSKCYFPSPLWAPLSPPALLVDSLFHSHQCTHLPGTPQQIHEGQTNLFLPLCPLLPPKVLSASEEA